MARRIVVGFVRGLGRQWTIPVPRPTTEPDPMPEPPTDRYAETFARLSGVEPDDPSTKCSKCRGSGDVRGFGYDADMDENTCPTCLGWGSRAVEDLKIERDLLLAFYQAQGHCMCGDAGCDGCEAAQAYEDWRCANLAADKEQT